MNAGGGAARPDHSRVDRSGGNAGDQSPGAMRR